ncbi:mediator of RNA polymerase II transcription subunit 5 [Aspergillus heteromorphus CBS 117.55]|uniref:Mediator of RNA polymerase II transcription subunit 5 n=1 Tax=Aspergillus heteromorphus CBS 117.55 TaxID=1448321 RepID=A0A317WIG9_9EURO|nr:mediator of RNA polymerase II transcription subunit 5 [Aspergillus heteromorphus CBS 117.55]PWY86256.1 mediator of RNA polymerase II transcription subunit 5 [Aspergillus heteromorphus CBS 117.55]
MTSSEQWGIFLRRCLLHRIDAAEFKSLTRLLLQRCPIAEAPLLDVLLETRLATGIKWDPLLPLYIDCLCKMGLVQTSTVLNCLLKYSSIHDKPQPPGQEAVQIKQRQKCYTLMTDIRVVQDAMLSVSTGTTPKTFSEAICIFNAIVDWIQAVVAWHNGHMDASHQTGGLMGSPDAVSLFESLGILLAALSGTGKGLEVLSAVSHEALKIKLGQALSAYLPLCVEVSLPLRNRLDSLQKEFGLFGEPPSKALDVSMMGNVNVNALQFEDSVMDGPMINSRAGLYVYINAMLVGRPLVDDSMLLNYLSNRYGGHYQALIEETITATFDVLSNASYRNESSRSMFLFRSFLVNKLPSFIAAMLAASMVSLPMELCISHALSRLDPNTFPSFSQMFAMQSNTALSDVRQEFLFACALHKLIPESSIERLLGENPMQTLPVGGPYNKDELVSQINANPERAEQLINEIESMEGNAGAIVGAITDVMHHLCNQKETMTLKNICNSLSRRVQALDVILLFRSARQVLQPLCALLDAWHWDEDQGESQPVYDEFGSILLLVLTFKYRYDLRPCDIGIGGNPSFVLRLLEGGSGSEKLDDLNEKQNKNLGAWINALFIAEGISEETMSSCSPQEFYILVTTLFSQSLGACEAGKLEFDTLKGGFEYLLEPFLLPSLVLALNWLGNHIWETENDPTISLKALQSLVTPSSISGEAKEIHRTVLNITARSLEEQLKDVRARHPSRTDIKPIMDALEPYLSFQRSGSCHRSEFEPWTTHSPGGLLGSMRNTFQSLVLWSTSPDMSMAPQSYTHRQLIAGIRVQGSTRVLAALVEELKLQTEAGNGDLALDIVATLICAPLAESFAVDQNNYSQHPIDPTKEPLPRCPILTLRDALFLLHENVPKISEKDPLRAEVIVRLYRRVNVLMTPPTQVPNLDMNNIIQNMQLGVGGPGQMDLDSSGGPGHDDNINQILDSAAAAVGMDGGQSMGGMGNMGLESSGGGLDTSIDDVLNAADMAVGNPEFLDLDMEGLF